MIDETGTRMTARRNGHAVEETDWDVIVVGSGLGGLSTAAYLAVNGRRTLVLEQHDIVGGCAEVFRRKNRYEFDAGIHYVGDCQPGGVIPTVLRGLGLADRIKFLPMDPDGFDTMWFPDFTFRVPAGWDNYRRRLIEQFPGEGPQLTRCIGELRGLAETLERVYAPRSRHPVLDALRRPRSLARLARAARLTVTEFLDRFGLSEQARAVLSAWIFYLGLTPATTPAVSLALLLWHFVPSGGWYPRGGSQVLAANLVEALRAHGGAVRTKAWVDKVLVTDGRVAGVRLTDGQLYRAPVVVSGVDVKRTYLELVGPEHLRASTVKRALTWRMAGPAFSVYLGLDLDLTSVLRNSNYWVLPNYDIEAMLRPVDTNLLAEPGVDPLEAFVAAEDLLVWIVSASLKDPHGHTLDTGGHSTMEIVFGFPDDRVFTDLLKGVRWTGEGYQRDPEYLRIKNAITERVIAAATSAIPELDGHIVWQEASTPLSHARYTGSTAGNWGGVALSPGQLRHRPRPRTEIPGLFLAGSSTIYGPATLGTLRGGVATAGAILRRNLWKEIAAGHVFGDPSRMSPIGPDWDPFRASKGFTRKRGRTPRPDRPVTPVPSAGIR